MPNGDSFAWSCSADRYAPNPGSPVILTVYWEWMPDYQGDPSLPPSGNISWNRSIDIKDTVGDQVYAFPYIGNSGTATSILGTQWNLLLPGDTPQCRHATLQQPIPSEPELRDEPPYLSFSYSGPPPGGFQYNYDWPISDAATYSTSAGSAGELVFTLSWDLRDDAIVSGQGLGSGSGAIAQTVLTYNIVINLP